MNKEGKSKRSPFRLYQDTRLGLPEPDFRLTGAEFQEADLDFEITFMEGILQRDPHHEDALCFLGHAYTARGNFAEGLEIDKRLVRLRPTDAIAFYNLACSFSLVEDVDKAFEALRRAIGLGYNEIHHMMEDPHLENVRRDRRFGALLARMKRLVSKER